MKLGKATLFGTLGAAMISTGAMAADIPQTIPVAPPPIAAPAPTFNWAGPYVGAYAGRIFWFDDGEDFTWADWLFGGQAGYNIVNGNFLYGAEVRAGVIDNFGDLAFEGEIDARAGVILGDRVLTYAQVGVGTVAFDEYFWTVGGGVEVGIGDAFSVFAEAGVRNAFGAECCEYQVMGGFNFHLGQ